MYVGERSVQKEQMRRAEEVEMNRRLQDKKWRITDVINLLMPKIYLYVPGVQCHIAL